MSGTRVSTGVPIADDLLGGGIARGSPVLVRAHPLVDVFKLGVQFLRFRLEQGDLGLYFVNNKPPASVVEESDSIGQSLGKFKSQGNLAFIDGYSGLFGIEGNESFSVDCPMEPENISDVVSRAIMEKSKQGKVALVLDSLNTLIDQWGDRILSDVSEWNKIGLVHDSVIYYLYTEWGYPTATSQAVASLFPDIIDLKSIERIVAGQVMTVSKTDGEIVERNNIAIKYVTPGGIRGYIPKILVTGPFHAGKTTVVHSLSTRAVSVQRMGTTIALDFGHVDRKGFALDLFGTVGQPRFDPILKQLGGEALAVVLVLDSTKPEEFPRAKEMMLKAGVYGLPYVVAANKQDLPSALTVEQIRDRMRIPENVVIVGTVAMDRESVIKALDALIERIVSK